LTFYGDHFSDHLAARFPTISLQGTKSTLDLPFDQIFTSGGQDSAKLTLDYNNRQHLALTTGAVYLVDTSSGAQSADSVVIVVVPSVFSILQGPEDLIWGGGHSITLKPGSVLYLEGTGLVPDSTILILPRAGGDTLHLQPLAIGSAEELQDGSDIIFQSDSIVTGLMAKFVVPADLASAGGIQFETHSGMSSAYFYKIPKIDSLNRIGHALRGTPADPNQLAVNVGDTVRLWLSNMASSEFPSIGPFLLTPGAGSEPIEFIRPDSSLAQSIVPARMYTGTYRVENEYAHALDLFTYTLLGDPSPLVQVVPTLDSLGGQITAPGFFIQLFGSGFRGSNTVVKFTAAGGGTTEVHASSNDGLRLSVRVPDDALPGPVYVETPGGRSDSVQFDYTLTPLEIIATAERGWPADTNEASANSGQTITIRSTGLTPGTRFRFKSGTQPYFALRNISADSTTAEVVLSKNVRIETGLVQLEDVQNNRVSETRLLQIVPTIQWVSSPRFAPGNRATVHGTSFTNGGTTVWFTDSTNAEVTATIVKNYLNKE
ncbi:MAG: hypothetical protein D6814_15110, partial [Calditrichaeota bacterium]